MGTTKRLTSTELSAEFYRAALDLSQAHTDRKVLEARRLLTVQRFAHTPDHDMEERRGDERRRDREAYSQTT